MFEPKATVPPIATAIAPIMIVGSNLTAPDDHGRIKSRRRQWRLEIRMIFRHLSIRSASSSMWASIFKTCLPLRSCGEMAKADVDANAAKP
jgi:hypothetical protein